MSKYYKSLDSELIIKAREILQSGDFEGKVIVANEYHKIGYITLWIGTQFEPYTPTSQELIQWGETATLTSDNQVKVEVDDKDVNLRLECLKLALQYQISNPLIGAQGFYDWITTNQTS